MYVCILNDMMMNQMMMVARALLVLLVASQMSECQQSYVNNKQLNCNRNFTETWGYSCNGAAPSCTSYLTFRSTDLYNSPATIGFLLSADPTSIFRANANQNVSSSDVSPIPSRDTLVIVPVNCSCSGTSSSSSSASSSYYQHNASYVLKTQSETYFSVANNTYQGLTTCQSLISQNPGFNFRQLKVGMKLTVPLRCACPTPNQAAAGVKYLLSYLVSWGDDVSSISHAFGGLDPQSIYDANRLSSSSIIFPFTPLLVPLLTEPTNINLSLTPPPPPPPQPPTGSPGGGGGAAAPHNSTSKWLFVGIGVGGAAVFLVLAGFLVLFLLRARRRHPPEQEAPILPPPIDKKFDPDYTIPEENSTASSGYSLSVSAKGVRDAIEYLTIYKLVELEKATGHFSEANRVKQDSSLYRGCFQGDQAAVKIMRGDVSAEINILKQINHSNIIRLSGFCVHQGHTYLVYEFAEKGSLGDWLQPQPQHFSNKGPPTTPVVVLLGWRQRVQIAYDVADALNYLHNYANPPYIHKNLKTGNILLDANFRAKISNFGLARTFLENPGRGGGEGLEQQPHLTRHVVGTYGYMAPEYIENGLITPKLDVFSFGVVMLELLSAREAGNRTGSDKQQHGGVDNFDKNLLSADINQVLGGDNVKEKLKSFMDPRLKKEYPLDLAYSMAQLAQNCVARDLNSRPPMSEVLVALSKILSSSLDWDPSDEFDRSTSLNVGR